MTDIADHIKRDLGKSRADRSEKYIREQRICQNLLWEYDQTKPPEGEKRAGAIIMPGVTIGDNVVIGAGSVVTKDIPSNVVAVGDPCRVMREVGEHDRKYYFRDREIDMQEWQDLV